MPPLLLIFALAATAYAGGHHGGHDGGHFEAHSHREKGPRNIIIVEEAIECEQKLTQFWDQVQFFLGSNLVKN
jgi:hypothetical protein